MAASNRCWTTSRCSRPRSACTAGRASAGECLPDLLDDLGVAVLEMVPSQGELHRPIPAGAQALVGELGLNRGVHCRIGNPS